MRRALKILLLGMNLIAGSLGHADTAPSVELSIAQARTLAARALRQRDFATAIHLARGLLQADPEDAIAYVILAQAHGALGQAELSRKAAHYAYRFADTPDDRFLAGQMVARAAVQDSRFSLAQFWLRRTAIDARTSAQKEGLAKDYKALRQLNPWSLRIQAGLRPSSNVNNGSESALQIIEGVPVTGQLSGAAQALAGLIATLDVQTGYRLRANEKSLTQLGLRLYTKHVALSSGAQAQAPGARNADFSSHFAETSLHHAWRAGSGQASARLAVGQSWYGRNPTYRFARVSLQRGWSLGEESWLSLSGSAGEREGVSSTRFDATALMLSLRAGWDLANGDSIDFALGVRDTDATFFNDTSQSVSVRTGYRLGKPVGPAQIDLGVTLGYSDYPVYRSGFILVPGGRQDRSLYADINMTFEDWDYAGFAPSLRIRAGRTLSNDSRFKTRELSVSLGIESNF